MKKQIAVVTTVFMLIDQIIKLIVEQTNLIDMSVINNLFNLTYVQNTGGAWGIFSNNTILLIVASIIVFLILIKSIYEEKEENRLITLSYSLLLGGLLGNLVDRILRGYVVDYLHFYYNSYHFPVFNFADIIIVIGVILMIINIVKEDIYGYNSRRRKEKN